MTRYVSKSLAILATILATSNAAFADSPLAFTLSMDEAITKGLQANVNVLMAGTRIEEANGSRERRLSAYLPHVHIETPIAYQTRNLKAQGISFPNTPSIVGPFTSYDFRVYGDQTILDLQSYHSIKASEKDQAARKNDYEEARSQVIRQVTDNYIVAEYAAAKMETAESVVRTSEALEKLAKNQRKVGVADGLDVLRAQVQLANDRQNLLVAKNSYQKSLLVLARSIGVDLATRLRLSNRLVFKKLAAPQIEQAVQDALESRPDYRSLFSQRESLEEQLKSSRSRYLPKIIVSGNYGGSGQEISDIEPSYMIQANLVMTLFDLDRKGERLELESRLKRLGQQIADQRLGVEQDIRETLLNLDSADEQVVVAEDGLELAKKELQFASDRFKNGVVNNIEVVKAQDSLSRALDNKLNALAQHTEAKIALAMALGNTEKVYRLFLGIQ
ncbi:MAG: TolC family protein [Proteobacteria bacterium]|nr:TolC family protein [Pseudomonadota bacterium]